MKKVLGFLVLGLLFFSGQAFATGAFSITKTASTANPIAGTNFTYTVSWTCIGNCFDVQTSDTLPTNFAYQGSSPALTITNGVLSWGGVGGAYSMTNSVQAFTFWGNIPVYQSKISNTGEVFGTQGGDALSTTILAMATPTFTKTNSQSPTYTITATPTYTATPSISATFTITPTYTPTSSGPNQTVTAIWRTQTAVTSNIHATRTANMANVIATATAVVVNAAATPAAATAACTANATLTVYATQTLVTIATQTATALIAQQTQTAVALHIHQTATVVKANQILTKTAIATAVQQTATAVAKVTLTAQATQTMIVGATKTAIAQKTANYYLTASATFTFTITPTLTITLTPTATHNPSTPWSVGGTSAIFIYAKPAYLTGVYVLSWTNTAAGSGMIGVYNATSPTGCIAANYITSITSTAEITGTTWFDEGDVYCSNGIALSNTACNATILPKFKKATQ